MSDSDESEHDPVRSYKLKSRRDFAAWKQKTLSLASSKGLEHYILNDVSVESESDLDQKEEAMINESDTNQRLSLIHI